MNYVSQSTCDNRRVTLFPLNVGPGSFVQNLHVNCSETLRVSQLHYILPLSFENKRLDVNIRSERCRQIADLLVGKCNTR
jgi:hypothetical protein